MRSVGSGANIFNWLEVVHGKTKRFNAVFQGVLTGIAQDLFIIETRMNGRVEKLARPERFELPTNRFEAGYSIQLSYGRMDFRATSYH